MTSSICFIWNSYLNIFLKQYLLVVRFDLGTGTLGSSRYLFYFLMWLACVVSHLCREHNSSGFRVFLSSKTFGHKSCILVRLFLHRVNSHNYLYHHQNMDPRYPPSKRTSQKRQNNFAHVSWDCNRSSQRILFAKRSTWSCPWSETK